MAEITSRPKTLRSIDLDQELRIIEFGKAIYGFKHAKDCAQRLVSAGYSFTEIASAEAAEAIRREYKRQRMCGERRPVTTAHLRKHGEPGVFDWMATFNPHGMGDPVGTGRSQFEAVQNLFRQHAEAVHAMA
jgi:hypothetical protein